MFHKLIFSLLAVGTLGTFAACTSTGTSPDEPADAVAVKFMAHADSRATVTTNTTITNTPFAVYGDMVPTASAATATPTVIFNGTPVTYNATDAAWQYTNPQYWYPGHTHSFVAIHPASAVADAQYSNNQLSFTYTLPDSYSVTPDILVATHRRNYNAGSSVAPVAFNFTHILSRLRFVAQVKASQTEAIVIDQFSLHNVHTSATYTIAPASITGSDSSTDDYVGGWTDLASLPAVGNELFNVPASPAPPIPSIDPGEDFTFFQNNALFVIPQTIPEEIEVRIKYHSVGIDPQTVEKTAMLYPFTLQHGGEWRPGKSYTYTFAIGVDTDIVYVTPSVDDWVESLGGNYIIPD